VYEDGGLALSPCFGEEPTEGAMRVSVGAFRDIADRVDELITSLGF
jgi:hypothetical protein